MSDTGRAQAAARANKGGRPALLSRERILTAARRIPAGQISMPSIARRLGVSAAALYRHFDSRDSLLAALGVELAAGFPLRPVDSVQWREWLLDTSVDLLDFLLDNPVILAAPDWAYIDGLGQTLLEAAYTTLEGAGFDTVTAVQAWGAVSGHAYLGARLLQDVPDSDNVAPGLADATDANAMRWGAFARAHGTTEPRELMVHSLRWLVSILPEPGRSPAE